MAQTTIPTGQIRDGSIVNADIASGAAIDATKIGGGTVSNTVFGYISGLTSAAQAQIDGKVPITPSTNFAMTAAAQNTTVLQVVQGPGVSANVNKLMFGFTTNAAATVFGVYDDTGGTSAGYYVNLNTTVRVADQSPIELYEDTGSGTNKLTVKAAATIGSDFTMILPSAQGTSGQFLQLTNSGTGQLGYATPDHGVMTGLADDDHTQYLISATASSTRNVIGATAPGTRVLNLISGGHGGSDYNVFLVTSAASAEVLRVREYAGGLRLEALMPIVARNQNEIRLAELEANGSDYVGMKASAAMAASYTLTWPNALPGSSQFLACDASGNLSWTSSVVAAVQSLNGLTGATQTFADVDDTNVTVAISSVGTTHTFTMGWAGQLAVSRGGTGAATATAGFNALAPTTTLGDMVIHNGTNNVRLAVGTAPQVLGISAGQPAWQSQSYISHGGLSNLTSADDHTQYVFKTPTTDSRNIIAASGVDVDALVVRTASPGVPTGETKLIAAETYDGVTTVFSVLHTAVSGAFEIRFQRDLQITSSSSAQYGTRFYEAQANGSDYVRIVAPSSLASSFDLKLPTSQGTSGQLMSVGASGQLGWTTPVYMTSLNGISAASNPIQTFSDSDDTNVTLTITSAGSNHAFALGWTGQLAIARGGTGASTRAAAIAALLPATPAKGTVVVYNGTDWVNLGVGTNGYVLTADSAESSGVKWAAAAGSGDGLTRVYNESPSGTKNGVNLVFTLANTPSAGTVRLYKNGMRMTVGSGNDYTISGATITLEAGMAPGASDNLIADYKY